MSPISPYSWVCARAISNARGGRARRRPLPWGVAAAYDGKVYVFGTQYVVSPAVDGTLHRHSFEYDPARNEWRQIASMPVDGAVVAAVIGDKIYVVVSYDKSLLEYTPATDQWRQLAPRPSNTPPYAFTGAAVGGKIYLIGGDLPGPTEFSGPVFNDALDVYDPVTNTWSRGRATPMPVSIWSKNACVIRRRDLYFRRDHGRRRVSRNLRVELQPLSGLVVGENADDGVSPGIHLRRSWR